MLLLNTYCSCHSESTSLEGIEVFPHSPGWAAHTSVSKLYGPGGAILDFMVTSPSPAPNTRACPQHCQSNTPEASKVTYLRVRSVFARERLICYLFWKTPSGSYMPVKKSSCLWGNVLLGPGSVCKCALEAEERLVTDPSAAGRAAAELRTSYKLVQHLNAHF